MTTRMIGSDTTQPARRTFLGLAAAGAAAWSALGSAHPARSATTAAASTSDEVHLLTRHRRVTVDGVEIFYREAGRPEAPAVLLLHGFPTSSHMFRHLIPALADRWHVVAPDYPGFGFSAFPDRDRFAYSFAGFAEIIAKFTDAIGLTRYSLYIQDYGAPVGLRLALLRPDRVAGLIVQNGNAYEEGLSEEWAPVRAYWREPTPENRDKLRAWLGADGIRASYLFGVPEDQVELFAPETWTLDWQLMSRPGNVDLQLDLFGDYGTNVALYPSFQGFLSRHRPPTLIAWGRHDPFFTVEGARAYQRDLPDAELHLLDAGHFALESHGPIIAGLIRSFLARRVG
jgi:pimeloyl-ACP methyl ester carboxylesterase